jgi:uncharacterized protein YutE (UPF0331/DUF86 family)
VWVLVGVKFPFIKLSENQLLYIYSAAPQVVSAVYGLTLTGYIFLRNQQDRLSEKDETLVEIIDVIQKYQYKLILLITVLSVLSITVCLLVIALRGNHLFVEGLVLNIASPLFLLSLLWTSFFIVDVIRPEKIKFASVGIKAMMDEGTAADIGAETSGGLADFLLSFNTIESLLERYADELLSKGRISKQVMVDVGFTSDISYRKPRWTKVRILKALYSEGVITKELFSELSELVRYRNALVHGNDMTVSSEMVGRIKQALRVLEQSISIYLP